MSQEGTAMASTPAVDRQRSTATIWWRAAALGAVGALAVATLLAACGGTPSATTTTTPSISTTAVARTTTSPASAEDKASADAAAAYRAYHGAVGAMQKSGGRDLSGIRKTTIQDELALQLSAANNFRANGWHQVGDTEIKNVQIKQVSLVGAPAGADAKILLQSCEDSSSANAVDTKGKPVRPASAPTLYQWQVTLLRYSGKSSQTWFVAKTQGKAVSAC